VPVCNGSTNSYTASRAPTSNETWVWSANNGATVNAPNGQQTVSVTAGNQNFTLTLTITFANPDLNVPNPLACPFEVTVNNCSVNCTYTQGFYGNAGGMACNGTTDDPNKFSTFNTIKNSITAQGGTITIGGATRSVLVTNSDDDVNKVISILPGGGAGRAFDHAGAISITALPGSYLSKQGKINNNLFSQTLALSISMGINSDLGSFALEADKWLVTADVLACGSNTIKPCVFSCVEDGANPGNYIYTVTYTPYQVSKAKITQAIYNAMVTKDVAGLLALANKALNGDALAPGVTFSDLVSAVDIINNAFDGCRAFVNWTSGTKPTAASFCDSQKPSSTTPCPVTSTRINSIPVSEANAETGTLKVSAFPNPFKNRVNFVIASPVSGQAVLEVFNVVGQKLQTVYEGHITAGVNQTVEFKTTSTLNGTLIYRLRIGGKTVTGKLININQ
jgi:hypothetical protein